MKHGRANDAEEAVLKHKAYYRNHIYESIVVHTTAFCSAPNTRLRY